MKYFVIGTDWDPDNNSPWDALWHEGRDWRALNCLRGSLQLAAIWKSPQIQFQKRIKRPDVYVFVSDWAVTKQVRDLFAPIIKDEAEFLPLDVPEIGLLYVIHPLYPVDFDDRAEVSPNDGDNITMVRRYSFTLDPRLYDGPRHLFRMRQAKGSEARDSGLTLGDLIVSEKIKSVSEKAGIRGIVFNYACTA